MRKKSVMLIGFLPNPRIMKRIDVEKKIYELHLICWDKGINMLTVPEEDGFSVHKIDEPAGDDPLKRLVPYTRFYRNAFKLLKEIEPDLIHVQGIDMLKIAVAYKKTANKCVDIIYEVADLHRMLVGKQKSLFRKILQKYLQYEDKRLTKEIALLIVTSQKHIDTYFCKLLPEEKMLCIPNMPDLRVFEKYQKQERRDPLTIGYIGSVRYKEQMKLLICAAEKCGVRVMIAGLEVQPGEIETICKTKQNVEWIGPFDFAKQAAGLYEKCDVIYSVYDADIQNVRVAIPNKLYEAVYCELPIIVAKQTYLAELVTAWNVGVAVDHRNEQELVSVIRKYQKDPQFYREQVQKCKEKKSAVNVEKYNDILAGKLEMLER